MSTVRPNEDRLVKMEKNRDAIVRHMKVSVDFKNHLPDCKIWPVMKSELKIKLEKINHNLDNIRDVLYNNSNAPVVLAGMVEAKEQLTSFSEFVDNIISEGENYKKALDAQDEEIRQYEKKLGR